MENPYKNNDSWFPGEKPMNLQKQREALANAWQYGFNACLRLHLSQNEQDIETLRRELEEMYESGQYMSETRSFFLSEEDLANGEIIFPESREEHFLDEGLLEFYRKKGYEGIK